MTTGSRATTIRGAQLVGLLVTLLDTVYFLLICRRGPGDVQSSLFLARLEMDCEDDDQWEREYELRLSAMEAALARLDNEGIFGTGDERHSIYVNAEVMPPDCANTERARGLNPKEALTAWLAEAAEE